MSDFAPPGHPSAPSFPPPSPVPPSPTPATRNGWRPADDDVSLEAVDWRARTGLRRADRALSSIEELRRAVDTLTTTIAAADATINLWGGRGGKVLGAVVIGVAGLAAHAVWQWISTLHH